ncbi:glycosyltransferase family 4 protein [Croceivirga sp. JEA036]|uniref:glycosyltransferase family 4 protein n=1 Tax=Croceivirga sp. JEA036 TaxID=2721162 RepID=UPI00143A602F|nr:glycosyltransferase family 1 protein [Croceivirga sp. JEA036]NJB37533.1 glycosyltransferase family 4 protein [Croceivirga sp. JEA036]
MKIGYDAKRIFHNKTGLGNYGRDVIRILTDFTEIESFYLFNTRQPTVNRSIPDVKTTIVYPKGWFWKKIPALWRILGQWKQINENELNCYHGLSGEIPIKLKKQRVKTIVTIHDLIFLSHPHYYKIWDRIIYKLKFNYAVHAADHVIAISEQTKKDIIHFLKVKPTKISVVYQGCHNAFKQQFLEKDVEAIRRRYNLPNKFILNVGTIQERKNALTIIKAIKDTTYHLALVGGEKGYAKKLKKYIADHQMERQVTFVKNISIQDLPKLYQAATVFCYPSYCEGFGIPLIEALFSKLPIIVTKDGCFPEAAGPHSIYVNPDDPKEILEKIEYLYKNPAIRAEMASKGYDFAQRFTDQKVGADLLAIYNKLR